MSWQIPLLQRYIFGELLRTFAFVVSCLTVLLIVVGVVQNATEQGLGPMQILEVLPFIVPSMLPFTIPAAMLLTVCVVYGRIAGDQEVVAAKAAGISVTSLLWPAVFLGAVLSAASLLLTDQAIPWAMANIERRIVTAMEDVILDRLRTDHQYIDLKRGIDVTVREVQGRRLIHPVIRHRQKDGTIRTIQAQAAEIHLDLLEQRAIVTLQDAFVDAPPKVEMYLVGEHTTSIALHREEKRPLARHLPIQAIREEMAQVRRDHADLLERDAVTTAMALTTGDFRLLGEGRRQPLVRVVEANRRVRRLETEIQSRFALACSCFFFTLLGGPFAILMAKSQFLTSFLVCFVPIITGYYPLVLSLMVQAKNGRVDPHWAMWVGNGLLALAAAGIFRRVLRN